MLDKYTAKLLNGLAGICADGSYKIVEISELIKIVFPKDRGEANQRERAISIDQMLKFLQDNEMVDIKHRDERVYCICVLPRGRVYQEQRMRKEKVTISNKTFILVLLGSFLAAFCGTMLAFLIIKM